MPRTHLRMRTRRSTSLVVALFAVLGLLGACGQPNYRYVSNRSLGSFYKVPTSWTLQDITSTLSDGRAKELPLDIQTVWQVVFASGDPTSLDADQLPNEVIGTVTVFDVSNYYREQFSLSDLRSKIFLAKVDPIYLPENIDSNDVRAVDYKALTFADGVTGSRVVANMDMDPSSDHEAWITQDVVTLFDNRIGRVWVVSMHCDAACYLAHQLQIDSIADSFKVRL